MPGTYSGSGAGACTYCPPGYSCASASSLPALCPIGFWASGGTVSNCTACPPGKNPRGLSLLVTLFWHLISGTISTPSRTFCAPCPAGAQCSLPSAGAVTCSSGFPLTFPVYLNGLRAEMSVFRFYSLGGLVTACSACPAGAYCSSVSAAPQTCPLGSYSLGIATACIQCPAGTDSRKTKEFSSPVLSFKQVFHTRAPLFYLNHATRAIIRLPVSANVCHALLVFRRGFPRCFDEVSVCVFRFGLHKRYDCHAMRRWNLLCCSWFRLHHVPSRYVFLILEKNLHLV